MSNILMMIKLIIKLYLSLSLSLRGLFKEHKIVFSFMLCVDIMRQAGLISDSEWNFFLRGAAGVEKVKEREKERDKVRGTTIHCINISRYY